MFVFSYTVGIQYYEKHEKKKTKQNKWTTSIFYEWQIGRGVRIPVLDSGRLFHDSCCSTCSATAENVEETEVLSSCSFANVSVKVKNYRWDVSIRMYYNSKVE